MGGLLTASGLGHSGSLIHGVIPFRVSAIQYSTYPSRASSPKVSPGQAKPLSQKRPGSPGGPRGRYRHPYVRKLAGVDEVQKPQGSTNSPATYEHQLASCRTYAMTENAQLKNRRLHKLDLRAHWIHTYVVGTNIFRVWTAHQGKVISTRDVLFGGLIRTSVLFYMDIGPVHQWWMS